MKKIIAFLTLASLLSVSVFSQESSGEREKLLSDETVDALKEGGSRFLLDMQSAFKKAGNALDKQLKSTASKMCIGSWQFVNGKCSTTIKCLSDNSMEVIQKSPAGTTSWRGTYEATLTQIEFNVVSKTSSTLFFKKNDPVKESWIFDYRIPSEGSMRISSDSLPDDANGYDFSNPTLFSLD